MFYLTYTTMHGNTKLKKLAFLHLITIPESCALRPVIASQSVTCIPSYTCLAVLHLRHRSHLMGLFFSFVFVWLLLKRCLENKPSASQSCRFRFQISCQIPTNVISVFRVFIQSPPAKWVLQIRPRPLPSSAAKKSDFCIPCSLHSTVFQNKDANLS